ncbi:hypothetical protein HaLaN_29225, partial [Haematococcus lacustris]
MLAAGTRDKTGDAAHTAVLKDVLAQVTSSARHRGIV